MKKRVICIFVLFMFAAMAACGQTSHVKDRSSSSEAASSTEHNDTYPVSVTSYDGNGQPYEQTFDKAPERILCNQPQAVQLLLKLGLKDKIIAACRSVGDVGEEYKTDFESLNIISENDSPQKEMVLAQQPDIIIGWGSTFGEKTLGAVGDWNTRGIHTYIMENTASNTGSKTVERLYSDIEKLGTIFGVQEHAKDVIREMQESLSSVSEAISKIPQEERPNVLTVQQVYENEFFGRAKEDLTSNLIELAGGNSLDEEYGKQSLENLIKLNPDIILVINRIDTPADEKIQSLTSNPSLETVPAVANRRFVVVDYVDFYGGNAETANTVKEIAKEFFPDEFKTQHYPVTVTTYNENGETIEQTFEKAPEKVISIAQANTELLIALGLRDRIIATAHRLSPVYDVMADAYNSIECLAKDEYPSKEVVLAKQPDMLIGWGSLFAEDAMGGVADWHARGIHTYLMNNTVTGLGDRTVEFLYDDIEKLGKIFDVEDQAAAMISNMQSRISAISDKVSKIPPKERVRALTVQFVYENEYLGRGGTDFNRNLAELAGAQHIGDNGRQSMEVLIDLNPDVLVILNISSSPAKEKIDAIRSNPVLQNINAVKNNRFVILDHVAFYCGGPRTIETIETLFKEFYPEFS